MKKKSVRRIVERPRVLHTFGLAHGEYQNEPRSCYRLPRVRSLANTTSMETKGKEEKIMHLPFCSAGMGQKRFLQTFFRIMLYS